MKWQYTKGLHDIGNGKPLSPMTKALSPAT